MNFSIKMINDALSKAAQLNHQIIGIFGSDTIPNGSVPVSSIAHDARNCLAKALFTMARAKETPPIYVGGEALKECCWAAATWLGYRPMPPMVEYMLSSGTDDSGRPKGMFLKDTPDICRESLSDLGAISPINTYLVAQSCISINDPAPDVRSILCFGSSEQIRILCALVHFGATKAFSPIVGAWGSGCATFVAYPAGLAANCPKDAAFLSPMAPEAHGWFPENFLALGIPISVAARMAEGYPRSFAAQRPEST